MPSNYGNYNPFFVQPAGLEGLGAIADAYGQKNLAEQKQKARLGEISAEQQGIQQEYDLKQQGIQDKYARQDVVSEREASEKVKERERVESEQQAKQLEVSELIKRGDPEEIKEYIASHPDMATGIEKAFGFASKETARNAADTSFNMLKALATGGDTDEMLKQRAAMLESQGLSAKETLSLVGKTDEEKKTAALIAISQYGTEGQKKALKDFGYGSEGGSSTDKVGAQEILEDGTVIQSTATGIKVYNPEGKLVKGKDAADAIKRGRAEKVSNIRNAARQKRTAALEAEKELKGEVEAGIISQKEAANASIKAFDKIEAINEKIGLYDEGITLIDEGAGSGQIEKMFPSFKAASIKLDNLANRLGLDVVSNTTFGALSAGELAMAMSTALPTGLDGPELREWMVEKRDVQQKLADYLESAAIYLGTPGNTKVGWLKKKKLERRQGRKSDQGGQGQEGQTATNPQTGEKLVFRGGQWQAQ